MLKLTLISACSFMFFALSTVMLNSCSPSMTASKRESVAPTATPSIKESHVITEGSFDLREIRSCTPAKLFRDDTVKIEFSANHGRNFAIFNEKTREFYFLTENGFQPSMLPEEFRKIETLKLKLSEVFTRSDKTNSDGEFIQKPFFTTSGKYRIIIGHQGLDVEFESMPISGMCIIDYVNKPRPVGK